MELLGDAHECSLSGVRAFNGRLSSLQQGAFVGLIAYVAQARSPMVIAHHLNEDRSMSNPWLKKNPFMSMWLSGANSVANRARGRIAAEAKRQSTAAVNKAASDMFTIWTSAITGSPAQKRRRKR